MNQTDLITLYFERSNALQSLWTLYVVIIGGLLAFSSLRQRPDIWTTALVAVLYVIFAVRNLGGIRDVTVQRLAVRDAIQRAEEAAPTRQALLPTLLPPTYEEGRNVHLVTDALVILALAAIELRRRRYWHGEQVNAGYRAG